MIYPNLSAEMARSGVRQMDIARATGASRSAVSYWMSDNDCQIGAKDALAIKSEFFPDAPFEYLFSDEPLASY